MSKVVELFETESNAKGYPKRRTQLKVNIYKKTWEINYKLLLCLDYVLEADKYFEDFFILFK